MPYYLEVDDRELLRKLLHTNVCQECGGELEAFFDLGKHLPYLQCKSNPEHEGIGREASRYEKGGLQELNIPTRRKIMVENYGTEKTRALAKYMGGGVVMTKSIATEIVESLWGDAPAIEKTKCILLCQTYQLNPLMKHIYLIGYKRYKDKKLVVDGHGKAILDWSIQQGIGATRLLAQRKHNFSYLDMTPRKATQAEIDKVLGDTADKNCVYGFVHIKDVDTGAEAFGLRGIEKNASIKGTEKGNTHLNMACVRAERLALDRQYPGEMPQGIEVVDEHFIEAEYKVVDRGTGEIIESEAKELESNDNPPEPEPKREHWCEEHNCAYDKKVRGSSTWYAHKLPDGTWCNEIKKKADVEPKAEPSPGATESTASPDKTETIQGTEQKGFVNLEWFNESLKTLQDKKLKAWSESNLLGFISLTYKVEAKTVLEALPMLDKGQAAHFVQKVQESLEMA